MSIAARVVPFLRFFAGVRAIDIKVLKDLRDVFFVVRGPSEVSIRASERVSPVSVGLRGRWRGTGPRPTMKGAFCRPIASRPGGLSYGGKIETRRSLLPGRH